MLSRVQLFATPWTVAHQYPHEAIQRTEAYEYAQSLGAQACSPPSFQVGPDSSALLGVGLVSVHKAVAITGFIQRNKKREMGLEISRRS